MATQEQMQQLTGNAASGAGGGQQAHMHFTTNMHRISSLARTHPMVITVHIEHVRKRNQPS